jgi:septum formation protein
MTETTTPRLILASQSRSRRSMLTAAGLAIDAIPSDVDEAALKTELESRGVGDPGEIALALAAAKAEVVSRMYPEALVIGGDQVLALGPRLFDKPIDMAGARQHLRDLRGRTHVLISAVVLAQGGHVVWQHSDTAQLAVREFSDAFLDSYLSEAGSDVCLSVGAYQLEGLGAQLFERIDGDYFTILGMPLIALLGALRARGAIAA